MDNKRDLPQFLAPICCLHICKSSFGFSGLFLWMWGLFSWMSGDGADKMAQWVISHCFKNLVTWVWFREPMWSGKERTGAWKLSSDLHIPYLINSNTCKGIWVRTCTEECPRLVLTVQYMGVVTVCYLLDLVSLLIDLFEARFLHDSWLVCNFLHRPGWSPTGGYPPASAFCVLGLWCEPPCLLLDLVI